MRACLDCPTRIRENRLRCVPCAAAARKARAWEQQDISQQQIDARYAARLAELRRDRTLTVDPWARRAR